MFGWAVMGTQGEMGVLVPCGGGGGERIDAVMIVARFMNIPLEAL